MIQTILILKVPLNVVFISHSKYYLMSSISIFAFSVFSIIIDDQLYVYESTIKML